MNLSRFLPLLLLLTTPLALGQAARQTRPASPPDRPEALVWSLYQQVVARHPLGIPEGEDMKILAPYLSKALLHRIDLAEACFGDWNRQYPDLNLKPDFAWFESGLFSGDDEQAEPRGFQIERTESQKNGSFRVYVRLTYGSPPVKPWIWQVAAIVVQENGHFAIDDVIYLKEGPEGRRLVDSRLSEYLSQGCDGARWVGYGNQQDGLKQQR
ncbi:MAG: hypothetical protein ABR924_00295 [Terracidiphilus sp.]|jgi:hypothetical protein